VLRGSGNTFWHPPILPQTGSDDEGPHGSSNHNDNVANESGVNAGNGGRTTGGGNNDYEDSTTDYFYPLPMLQDEDSLFIPIVHSPMASPKEVCQNSGHGNDGNMHTAMYVDSPNRDYQ